MARCGRANPCNKASAIQAAVGDSKKYTSDGYAFVVQDVRGKFGSEGFYAPFANDIEDGYDTVEWAAAQPWSNGTSNLMLQAAPGLFVDQTQMVECIGHLVD
jgi:hypothetical protein